MARRLSSEAVDALRVRALKGDPLRGVPDATREWVFRSLLLDKRCEEWAELADIADDRAYERALDRVRGWYQQRLDSYKASSDQLPRKRADRPAPRLARPGWWPFAKR